MRTATNICVKGFHRNGKISYSIYLINAKFYIHIIHYRTMFICNIYFLSAIISYPISELHMEKSHN